MKSAFVRRITWRLFLSLRAGWLAIATALAATGVTAAQSAPAAPLNPTAKWWLDYDEAQCTAGRNDGDGRDFVQFGFKALPMGKIIRLLVARKGSFILGDQYPSRSSSTTSPRRN